MTENLRALLDPRSVAVIGASTAPGKPGGVLVRNITAGGFAGSVFPIHPKAASIQGLPCHPTIGAVPERVDLAFLVVRREAVRTAVQQCADAGVGAVVIITAGFGESDDWGREEQDAVASIVRASGMAAIGPNTIGLVSMGGSLRGSFVQFPHWHPGRTVLVAQSGVFAGAIADDEMRRGHHRLGLHASVAIGNRAGSTEDEFLARFGADPEVDVIGFYLESFADADAFLATAAEVKRTKPVVVLKSARTAKGAQAAASHTGSLAGDDAVLDQLMSQHGIVRAGDEEELLALLRAFAAETEPPGRRVGVVTFSGALGVLASDHVELEGLQLAGFREHSIAAYERILPTWQRPRNPVDLWPAVDIDPRQAVIDGLRIALADDDTDQVLGILLAVANADFADLRGEFQRLRAETPRKPLHLVIRGALSEEWSAAVDGLDISVHPSVRLAVKTMGATAWYEEVHRHVPNARSAVRDIA